MPARPFHHCLHLPETHPVSDRHAYWLLAFIMALAFALRAWMLQGLYMGPDEGWHLFMADHASLREVLAHGYREDVHPPIYKMLLSLLIPLTGRDPEALRWFSVVIGMALIPLWFAIGRYLAGNSYGIICATFMAFWQGPFIQSLVIREYNLMLVFLSGGLYLAMCWWDGHRTRHLWAYALAIALAMFSQYSAVIPVFVLGGLGSLALLWRRQWRDALAWIALHAALAGLFLASYLQHDWLHSGWNHSFYPLLFLVPRFLMMLSYLNGQANAVTGLLGLLLLLSSLYLIWHKHRPLGLCLVSVLFSGIGFHAAHFYPFDANRHGIYALIACAPALAYGLYLFLLTVIHHARWKNRATYARWSILVFVLLAFSILSIRDYTEFHSVNEFPYRRTEYDALLDQLSKSLTGQDVLIVDKQTMFAMRWHPDWKDERVEGDISYATWKGHPVLYPSHSALQSFDDDQQPTGGLQLDYRSLPLLLKRAEALYPPAEGRAYRWAFLGFPQSMENMYLLAEPCTTLFQKQGWVTYTDQGLQYNAPVSFIISIPSQRTESVIESCNHL